MAGARGHCSKSLARRSPATRGPPIWNTACPRALSLLAAFRASRMPRTRSTTRFSSWAKAEPPLPRVLPIFPIQAIRPSIGTPPAARDIIASMNDWQSYVETLGKSARRAAGQLAALNGAARSRVLMRIAAAIRQNREALIAANQQDVAAAQAADLQPALVERLKLNEKRVGAMADGVEQIA